MFNPATPLSYLDYVMDKIDVILLMSVNLCFGGQSFIHGTSTSCASALIDDSGRDIRPEVDGGVKVDNIAEIALRAPICSSPAPPSLASRTTVR